MVKDASEVPSTDSADSVAGRASIILESSAFSSLDQATQGEVSAVFKDYIATDEERKFNFDVVAAAKHRRSLATSLDLYSKKLAQTNIDSFKFLTDAQRKAKEQELLFTFYLLVTQFKLDEAEHRRQSHGERVAQIHQCTKLIMTLRQSSSKETPTAQLQTAIDNTEKTLKYLGLTIIGPEIAKRVEEMASAKSSTTVHWMSEFNSRRLYWVWGGGLLTSVISMLPDGFGDKLQGEKVLAAPSPVLGYISWILYYARLGISLGLLLKHTIAGPWMSEEERKIPAFERFKTQWDKRKFSILNDAIWATVNLVTFFWLTGNGMLGYYGNVLTAGLLLFDVCMNVWRLCEEQTRHAAQLQKYDEDIKALNAKISAATDDKERKELEEQLKILAAVRAEFVREGRYKRYSAINDLVYSVSLFAAFAVVCCVFMPPALIPAATSLLLGVVGAAICFTLTVAYSIASTAIEIAKFRSKKQAVYAEAESLLQAFKECTDVDTKKLLYLDIKQVLAESAYQEKLAQFQKIKLIRGIFIDAFMPPIILASLLFLPLGAGLGVIAAAIAIGVISYFIVNRLEPKAEQQPSFSESAYEAFVKDPSLENLTAKKPGFFSEKSPKPGRDGDLAEPQSAATITRIGDASSAAY